MRQSSAAEWSCCLPRACKADPSAAAPDAATREPHRKTRELQQSRRQPSTGLDRSCHSRQSHWQALPPAASARSIRGPGWCRAEARAVMHIEDTQCFSDIRRVEHRGFSKCNLGIFVARLPVLFHRRSRELERLARNFIFSRLIFKLHNGRRFHTRFLFQEFGVGIVLILFRKPIEEPA
jgi:hypothetical protein